MAGRPLDDLSARAAWHGVSRLLGVYNGMAVGIFPSLEKVVDRCHRYVQNKVRKRKYLIHDRNSSMGSGLKEAIQNKSN